MILTYHKILILFLFTHVDWEEFFFSRNFNGDVRRITLDTPN